MHTNSKSAENYKGQRKKIGKDEGGLRTGKGSVDQISNISMIIKKMLANERKLYVAASSLKHLSLSEGKMKLTDLVSHRKEIRFETMLQK